MKVTLRVERFNAGPDPSRRWQDFTFEAPEGATVLDCLMRIKDEQDPTLTFRRSCRSAICGSCGMNIAGVNRLACYTQVSHLRRGPVKIRPLPGLPVIKDLVVNMDPFMDKYRITEPYIVPRTPAPEKEYLQSPAERRKLDEIITCIMCGCCTTSCPVSWTNPAYLGPAAFGRAYRFVIDSRDTRSGHHLKPVTGSTNGVWRCHHIANCVDVCPKSIDLPWLINELRKRAL